MSILIKGMEMPKDCPMCIAAHYNKLDEFTGCEIVSGKKYAVQRDAEYANSSTRPDWCPLVPIPPHGRMIDADALTEHIKNALGCYGNEYKIETTFGALLDYIKARINDATTIIEADKEEQK